MPRHRRGRPGEWKAIGAYVSERAWGTVREDYSADGKPWAYFPYEHARSRAYRWNEDGLAGICDLQQRMCFALTFWNGRDPFLKERIFGLAGPEGNHGEDAKLSHWRGPLRHGHQLRRRREGFAREGPPVRCQHRRRPL